MRLLSEAVIDMHDVITSNKQSRKETACAIGAFLGFVVFAILATPPLLWVAAKWWIFWLDF